MSKDFGCVGCFESTESIWVSCGNLSSIDECRGMATGSTTGVARNEQGVCDVGLAEGDGLTGKLAY
jgi:hypothetical protein